MNPAEDPLNDAEILFRQPGPPLLKNLTSQHQKLVWLIGQANGLPVEQLELRAHWARYICVLASGFLENALREVYASYARTCSAQNVGDYVESQLDRVQNPKANRFVETAQTFNKKWARDLTDFMDDDGRREAIDAIMANRHLIAHGKDSGITLARVSDRLCSTFKLRREAGLA